MLYGQPLLEWLRLVRDLLWRLVGVCYKLGYVAPGVVSRPPTEIQIDTIEFKPMERDDDSIARDTIGKLLPLR